MIEEMKFLSITGPREDIDRIVDTYLSRYETHLENALSKLRTVKDLRSYIETDPYKDVLKRVSGLLESYHDPVADQMDRKIKLEEVVEVIDSLDTQLKELTERENTLMRQWDELKASRNRAMPFVGPNYNAKKILKFRFIKFRLGHISREYCEKFSFYVYEAIDTAMFRCEKERDYARMIYFVLESPAGKIDAIYTSVYFERCFLSDEYESIPVEVGHVPDDRIGSLQKEIDEADREIVEAMSNRKEEFATVLRRIRTFSVNFNVGKMAAVTKHDTHNFYILCGWMTEKGAEALQKEVGRDSDTFCIIKNGHNNIMSTPPTRMKNLGLFRPFKMYVEMYGLPSYNEPDPTVLIGIAYSILLEFMFGDTGQELCLLIGGFPLYRSKKVHLAGVISCCGMFPTVSGLPLRSVFGFEDIMDAVWLRFQEAMTDLPFIGKLDTVFVAAVAIGIGIILLCIILNVINSPRSHDVEKVCFDTNGMAKLVFYFALISVIVLYMTGNLLSATVVLVIMFLIPSLMISSKEPLAAIMEKKTERTETGLGMFIAQGIFELFGVLLSYFPNTLSSIRVGAFTVSHAAMMQVVLMLAGTEARGNTSWAVVVGGNLFVCSMEGLIVGIQVLRLEYYELFSRFYHGSGRTFEPYGKAVGEQ